MGRTWRSFVELNRAAVREVWTGQMTRQVWRMGPAERVFISVYLGLAAFLMVGSTALLSLILNGA